MKKEQLEELLSQLTTDEKLGMIHGNELFATKGVERLGIPPFRVEILSSHQMDQEEYVRISTLITGMKSDSPMIMYLICHVIQH